MKFSLLLLLELIPLSESTISPFFLFYRSKQTEMNLFVVCLFLSAMVNAYIHYDYFDSKYGKLSFF